MTLTSRITLSGPPESDPEDFLASSLGVIFPDDVTNQHGDPTQSLLYTSPHLPNPLHLTLCNPTTETDRTLFSHFLWNASLQLAELVEFSTLLPVPSSLPSPPAPTSPPPLRLGPKNPRSWDVAGKSAIELGAGTALPSLMAGLIGAKRVVITDYPTTPVLDNLKANLARCHVPSNVPVGKPGLLCQDIVVEGHAWGDVGTEGKEAEGEADAGTGSYDDGGFAAREKGAFDRVLACDCLWMPWQHGNLRRSIAHFMAEGNESRAWVVAGFHTGRAKMRGFYDEEELAKVGLEVEGIWERDCDGVEREWAWDQGVEDVTERKRWLVIGILKRVGV